jgi:hypothetical protein
METLLIILIVAAAAAYFIQKLVRSASGSGDCTCSGNCTHCRPSENGTGKKAEK